MFKIGDRVNLVGSELFKVDTEKVYVITHVSKDLKKVKVEGNESLFNSNSFKLANSSVMNNVTQLELLIISVYHSLCENELIDNVDGKTVNFVENLIDHRDDLQVSDLLDTIEILKSEIIKLKKDGK